MRNFIISDEVKISYPEFSFWGVQTSQIEVTKPLQFVTAKKKQISSNFRTKYNVESISSVIQVKAVRDFFIKMGVNPDIEPTAVENLTRLIFKGGLPNINSVVDSCNLASIGTLMPIGAFDADQIHGDLLLRFSTEGEKYIPIGMEELTLKDGIIVLADDDGVIARPIYKDSIRTMITLETKSVYIFTAQYPPISDEDVIAALKLASEIVVASSKGIVGEVFKFK